MQSDGQPLPPPAGGLDRRAIARAQRREQVLAALEFERARSDALREQLESIVAELDGPALDAEVFARLDPADVEVVRPVVQSPEPEPVDAGEWLSFDEPGAEELDVAALREEEIERLAGEIASSRGRQEAFERYLEALGEG